MLNMHAGFLLGKFPYLLACMFPGRAPLKRRDACQDNNIIASESQQPPVRNRNLAKALLRRKRAVLVLAVAAVVAGGYVLFASRGRAIGFAPRDGLKAPMVTSVRNPVMPKRETIAALFCTIRPISNLLTTIPRQVLCQSLKTGSSRSAML